MSKKVALKKNVTIFVNFIIWTIWKIVCNAFNIYNSQKPLIYFSFVHLFGVFCDSIIYFIMYFLPKKNPSQSESKQNFENLHVVVKASFLLFYGILLYFYTNLLNLF